MVLQASYSGNLLRSPRNKTNRIIVSLDNNKRFILSKTNRLYSYCLKYLKLVPIPPDSSGNILIGECLMLPEELLKYLSIDESVLHMSNTLAELSSEIGEMDSIWWETSEWKFKSEYSKKVDKYISILTGFGFLDRMDLIDREAENMEKESIEDNVYKYLYELVQVERNRWLKILKKRDSQLA